VVHSQILGGELAVVCQAGRLGEVLGIIAALTSCAGEVETSKPPINCTLPPTPSSCDSYSEEDVRPLVYDCSASSEGPIVPAGAYWEAIGEESLFWFEPCSTSLAETHDTAIVWAKQTAGAKFAVTFLSDGETEYFHETAFNTDDGNRKGVFRYRRTRCDYFDGNTLGGAPFDSVAPLNQLAGYLWFTEVSLNRALLAFLIKPAPEIQTSMCHARVYGELLPNGAGACESVELLQTDFVLDPATGSVTMSNPQSVRMFPKVCHD
jgi:hypothetical protein